MKASEFVDEYMEELDHPLKLEIQAVRLIMLEANRKVGERIKWNAPNFYYKEDLATFNTRALNHVRLVFQHRAISSIQSPILNGTYSNRRSVYFRNMDEIKVRKTELRKIVNRLIEWIDQYN